MTTAERKRWKPGLILLGCLMTAGLFFAGCRFDTSGISSETVPGCGNNVQEGNEICDGDDIPGMTCADHPDYKGGEIGCLPDCTGYDRSKCIPNDCGNGRIDPIEECDQEDLGDESCETLGLGTGTLSCNDACRFDVSGCSDVPGCGNGTLDTGEECDDGNGDNNDGCSAACQVEDFSACSGEPSECVCVVYVNNDPAISTRDGAFWNTAFSTVQEGIGRAGSECEVWVARGTYNIWANGSGDTLHLANDIGVYGGFVGNENDRDQRNWLGNETVLDGQQDSAPQNRVERVVTATGVNNAVLDGFTVTHGRGSASGGEGGGLLVDGGFVTVENCLFRANEAEFGGGIYLRNTDSPVIGSHFAGNTGYSSGGGIYIEGRNPTVDRCLFENNVADGIEIPHGMGGGVRCENCGADIGNCVFVGNSAGVFGGGVQAGGGTLDIFNSVFFSNSASGGGGEHNNLGASTTLVNCTFHSNSATGGADMGGAIRNFEVTSTVINSILWGNIPNEISNDGGGGCTVSYSLVSGGYAGTENQDDVPRFEDAVNGDFHLRSISPCIDSGSGNSAPPQDIEGNLRVDDPNTVNGNFGTPPYVDRGAFEYQP